MYSTESDNRKSKSSKLRRKTAIFFLIIPTLLMTAASAFSIWQLNTLKLDLTQQHEDTDTIMAKGVKRAPLSRLNGSRLEHHIVFTRNKIVGIWGGAIVLTAAIVTLFGYRLTKKIQTLSDLAKRISLGDLKTEVNVHSNDEIGTIAEAIERLQTSICLALERLRSQRS